MKTLVTYESKTGFTQKYAEWIAQELAADIKELARTGEAEVASYDLVLHGGWIMGGMVSGLGKVRSYHPVRLAVFGVGFTSQGEIDSKEMAAANGLDSIPLFYCEGGMNPAKMGLFSRLIVRMVTKKPLEYVDQTDREQIRDIVSWARELDS